MPRFTIVCEALNFCNTPVLHNETEMHWLERMIE